MPARSVSRRTFLRRGTTLALGGVFAANRLAQADEPDDSSEPETIIAANDLPPEQAWKHNERITEARALALEILKPKPAELEHGLELHRESLVFDGYGFSPRSAIDNQRLAEAMRAGASDIELKDMREDMMMTRWATDPAERAECLQAWAASGVTCQFQNAGEEGQDPLRMLKRLARFTYATDLARDDVFKAAGPEEIVAAKEQGRRCLYFTANGVPLRQQWISVEDELRYVRIFFQLGIRMMHLTYQRRNMLGDGCGEPTDGGVSDFGRAAIDELNRQGVILDVAHCGWQTSLESARHSKQPMVASHTTCTAVHEHIRSKPDEVIRAICDTGGHVGICCIPSFLGGKGDISAMLDHIDYAARRFGADHVSIGTDVAYQSRNRVPADEPMPKRGPRRKEFRSLWPEGALGGYPAEASRSMAWTNWPLFTVGLVQRGYKDDNIRKIIGGNVLRVARAVLGRS
jgi:membrane dipeptidase